MHNGSEQKYKMKNKKNSLVCACEQSSEKVTCHVLILTPLSVLDKNAVSTTTSCTWDQEFDFPKLPMLDEVFQN